MILLPPRNASMNQQFPFWQKRSPDVGRVAMKVRITSLGGMLSVGCRMALSSSGASIRIDMNVGLKEAETSAPIPDVSKGSQHEDSEEMTVSLSTGLCLCLNCSLPPQRKAAM